MFNKKAKQVFKPRPPYPTKKENTPVVNIEEKVIEEVKQNKRKKKVEDIITPLVNVEEVV